MADDFDFQINDLKFRAAISDQFPYSRGTAPFRKEQLDTTATVGDQSLTGWWTRGQLSFHMGAGVKYYEVLDGEVVLNRFQKSRGVDVFSVPGEVSLNHELTNVTSTAIGSPTWAVVIPWTNTSSTSASGVYYRDDGALKFVDHPIGPTVAAVALPTVGTPGTGGPHMVTTNGQHIWFVSGGGARIESTAGGAAGSGAERYTHTGQITGVAYAKGRLWIVDANGDIYVEAAKIVGASSAISNVIGELPSTTNFRLAEAPSGVFVSGGDNKIYFITVDSDGTIPTLTAPTIAGQLPDGEIVVAMRYYLGNLVLVTSQGFRVAIVIGSELIFGPLLKELDYDTYGATIAVRGTSAFVIHQTNKGTWGGASVYQIDLSRPIGESGEFAWCEATQYDPSLSDLSSILEIYQGYVICGLNELLYTHADNLEPSGYVVTGYHRFGTLDDKAFRTVSVRVGGTGGSIDVYRVDANETETPLGSCTPAEVEKDLDVALAAPTERIALKFVLNRDGTDATKGPVLLGYQLKALPVPERQRILKWPLSISDTNKLRRGTGVGRAGRAYDDITTLEELETSTSIVTFTDHRTGETGQAYIDGVEFQSDTPSTATTNGFGGVAYVTLRVLS